MNATTLLWDTLVLSFKLLLLVYAVMNSLDVYRIVRDRIRDGDAFRKADYVRLTLSVGNFLCIFFFTPHVWLGLIGFLLAFVSSTEHQAAKVGGWKQYWNQPAFPAKPEKIKIPL